MNIWIVVTCSLAYLGVLFGIAYFSERYVKKGKSLVSNPYIYALSLAVYCTAWTYYGSVGRAATSGAGFLPIYLGPTISAPLWLLVLRKIVLISKHQRITSIADFISSRYGKSTFLGVCATLVAVIGIIPYISIQLKAISNSFGILTNTSAQYSGFYLDKAFYVTIVLAIFTILFGTRRLDASERHEGMIAAIAFESIIKIVAFLVIGVFVTFGIYNGFGDLFEKAVNVPEIKQLFTIQGSGMNGFDWFWMAFLSMAAILLLPRQFHVAVVENTNPKHINTAVWLFPLYLLIINVFVLPIAFGGLMQFSDGTISPDTFVLTLPMANNHNGLALLAYLGGLSAATSMVIVATIALSIMVSNNLVMPFLTSSVKDKMVDDLAHRLLNIRRLSIGGVLILSYGYFRLIGESYTLVSIGLISFAAVAQFFPIVIGGIYWKSATKKGAIAGLIIGFIIWAYTLPLPTLADVGMISNDFVEYGPWNIQWLKPTALFGLDEMSFLSQSIFWSLFFNFTFYVVVSLNTKPTAIEHAQADLFVNIYKYVKVPSFELVKREAKISDIKFLLNRFVGEKRTSSILKKYGEERAIDIDKLIMADAEMINYVEKLLTGAIGAASAKTVLETIVKQEAISLEEVVDLLNQTQEILEYSKQLEQKSKELEDKTDKLHQANKQLKELDKMKDDFITTVTHELRTPITSIKAFAKILQDDDLPEPKRKEFLNIIVDESERIARLINQVLDLKKLEIPKKVISMEMIDIRKSVEKAVASIRPIAIEKGIVLSVNMDKKPLEIIGNSDKMTQVIVNLLSNAIKFCDKNEGRIILNLHKTKTTIVLKIIDNGVGITQQNQEHIFDRFVQVLDDVNDDKPEGSGLGLTISKRIVEQHKGKIMVESEWGNGTIFIIELPLATIT